MYSEALGLKNPLTVVTTAGSRDTHRYLKRAKWTAIKHRCCFKICCVDELYELQNFSCKISSWPCYLSAHYKRQNQQQAREAWPRREGKGLQTKAVKMGNNNSLLQKVYLYLPVVMCHSRMDYGNPVTMRTMRMAYFLEQVSLDCRLQPRFHESTYIGQTVM